MDRYGVSRCALCEIQLQNDSEIGKESSSMTLSMPELVLFSM